MMRQIKSNRFLLYSTVVLISLLVAICLLFQTQCLKSTFRSYRMLEEHLEKQGRFERKRTKYILLYNSFFEDKYWTLPAGTVGQEYFESIQCPETDCVVTNNKDLLQQPTAYDAVLFHVARAWDYSLFTNVQNLRSSKQIYVAANMESPAHTKHALERDALFFNWTMTYRRDSDILWNYGNIIDKGSGFVVRPADYPLWRTKGWKEYNNDTLLKLVTRKTKMAAQFVSHCGSISRRDDLVKAIQKHMPVDVYGECGTLKCPRFSPRCTQMLTDDYRFFLAFENSLCRDYITEKLYDAMDAYIVPVVFGGADYGRYVPPNSYIDAQQFRDVSELVDYMQHLANNPEEYVRYFWWKDHYIFTESLPFCELCRKLHDIGTTERVQYYKNIKNWWFNDACQLKAKIKF